MSGNEMIACFKNIKKGLQREYNIVAFTEIAKETFIAERKMFSSITAFLLPAAIIFHFTILVDADYVDNVVTYCKITENRFSDNEDKYVKKRPRLPNEPEVFQTPFTTEQHPTELELSQRYFECIADTLQVFNDQKLENSARYRSLVQECKAAQPTCPLCDRSYPYRIINGTCNNLQNPRWGSTHSCFRRLMRENYEGVKGLRKSVKGKKPLPNTREISRVLAQNVKNPATKFNSLFAFFGQTVAHDLAQFPFTMVNDSKRLGCCEHALDKDQHPQCIPILLDPTDYFYSLQNVHCFNVARVIPCLTCSVGKRMPINYVTAWLDLSLVYGQTDERAHKLRQNDGTGKLKSQYSKSGELLPPDASKGSRCGFALLEQYCFQAGDSRVDQHTLLMMFHTLFLREHNRIADGLKQLNPHWDDEKLYQEARRILIAEWHVIVYKEYLPTLLGPKFMSSYGLNLDSGSNYDPSIDPSISVEFNAAAFRVHSIIPGKVVSHELNRKLGNLFLNTIPIYMNRMSSYLDQMANQTAEKYDTFFPSDLTIWMYRELVGNYGFDLPAIDIQRGRDVGLSTYVQALEYLQNQDGTINTFDDLADYITPECLAIFPQLYDDVRDIDFLAGLLCEKIPDDMIIPNTAAHFIAEQFKRLKLADRFYIEHDNTLTHEQRKTIMKTSLTKFICDNTEVEVLQSKSMLLESDSNKAQSCSEIPGVDLEKWKE